MSRLSAASWTSTCCRQLQHDSVQCFTNFVPLALRLATHVFEQHTCEILGAPCSTLHFCALGVSMSCFTNSPSSVLLLFMSVCSSVSGYINILLSVDRWVRSLEGAWKLNTGTCSIMPLRILFSAFLVPIKPCIVGCQDSSREVLRWTSLTSAELACFYFALVTSKRSPRCSRNPLTAWALRKLSPRRGGAASRPSMSEVPPLWKRPKPGVVDSL